MIQATDLTLPCLVHDLNNVFQTLVDAADLLAGDPQWAPVSAAILRSIERGKTSPTACSRWSRRPRPFETILAQRHRLRRGFADLRPRPRNPFRLLKSSPASSCAGTWAWERVLINLFPNAMRAMPDGGTIYISARSLDGRAEIIVRDEGEGIAPEILADLFRPHVSTKARGGLGLHIVETIVQQDGGEVHAANRPDGRGAEFRITLPAEKPIVRLAHA